MSNDAEGERAADDEKASKAPSRDGAREPAPGDANPRAEHAGNLYDRRRRAL